MKSHRSELHNHKWRALADNKNKSLEVIQYLQKLKYAANMKRRGNNHGVDFPLGHKGKVNARKA